VIRSKAKFTKSIFILKSSRIYGNIGEN